jgi:hypothetical protein
LLITYRDNTQPAAGKNFIMTTFSEPKVCDICGKLLRGVFFQGYKCPGKLSADKIVFLYPPPSPSGIICQSVCPSVPKLASWIYLKFCLYHSSQHSYYVGTCLWWSSSFRWSFGLTGFKVKAIVCRYIPWEISNFLCRNGLKIK